MLDFAECGVVSPNSTLSWASHREIPDAKPHTTSRLHTAPVERDPKDAPPLSVCHSSLVA